MNTSQSQPPQCPWGEHRWRDKAATDRPGWISTSCEICGKWLGNRPAEIQGTSPGGRWVGGSMSDGGVEFEQRRAAS